jgi:hypothetical protein
MNACPPEAPVQGARLGSAPDDVNELDLRRIRRLLSQRSRYRYVSPVVTATANGYRIDSPNCSRNVAQDGGVIPIALLAPHAAGWQLHWYDHQTAGWHSAGIHARLVDAVARLNEDPARLFWP